MDNQNETFSYSYSAKDQTEIKRIREKYIPREETAMERLRRLDASVTQKASLNSLIVGIVGALLLGFGMSLTMSELSTILGSYKDIALPVGILIGIAGIVLVSLAYPLYNRTLKKERERIAPEILRLTDELMK